ncbi:unnamed protein product [Acanthosepion pharaonis]|uniref:NAD-dependent epimerase/dehydratase domain-containing protein n=1 Tax=Acanthosepion pharaonis TaxID=158019 RepID=A0A812DU94_ACAPH|nr:unnamed protein product [Sepia pharaonis]
MLIKPFVHHLRCDRMQSLYRCDDMNLLLTSNPSIFFDTVIDFSAYHQEAVSDVMNILQNRIGFYVLISTDSVYEVCIKNHFQPTRESDAVRPTNEALLKEYNQKDDYGNRKLQCEEILTSQSGSNKVPYIIYRLPDVIGPRDNTYRWWIYQSWMRLRKYLERPVSVPDAFVNKPMSLVYVEDVADVIVKYMFGGEGIQNENPDYGKTTCVKFHGNLLLTGHENGAVLCWANAGTKTQTCTTLHRHRSTVTALTVVDKSNLKNGKSPVFTVISGSEDRDLRFTTYEFKPLKSACYNHSTAITSISSWGQYFVTGSHDTILCGQWVFHLSSNLKWERCHHLLGHSCSYVRSTAIWGNKVVTGDDDGNVYIWELIETNKRYLLPLVIHTLPGPVQQTLICGDRILCLANKDVLAVSLNGEKFYKFSVYNELFRNPECLGAWGPILAIGLKSGIVAVYHFENDAEWQNINVSKPLQMLHSGQEHVIDVDITDSGLGLSITFSTDDNSVHLAHWLPHLPQTTT